jgi:hypothetical protein
MTKSLSNKPSARTMRDRAVVLRSKGWVRNSFFLSREAIEVLDSLRDDMGLNSREATLGAVLERLGQNVQLQRSLLASNAEDLDEEGLTAR